MRRYLVAFLTVILLKDASQTAQYGSRGAAGVIQVATKKGRNQPFHISYDGSVSIESVVKRMEMLDASQFRQTAASLGMPIADMGHNTDFSPYVETAGARMRKYEIDRHATKDGHTTVYPIPVDVMALNPLLEQNYGY